MDAIYIDWGNYPPLEDQGYITEDVFIDEYEKGNPRVIDFFRDNEFLEEDEDPDIETLREDLRQRERFVPMMNFGYHLQIRPSDSNIIEAGIRTNTCVMENIDGDLFIALTGGGMDLSQDIALAFYILEKRIGVETIRSTSTQKNLTVYGDEWKELRKIIISEIDKWIGVLESDKQKWIKDGGKDVD